MSKSFFGFFPNKNFFTGLTITTKTKIAKTLKKKEFGTLISKPIKSRRWKF